MMQLRPLGTQKVVHEPKIDHEIKSNHSEISFKDKLIEAINKVNQTEKIADAKTIALAKGEDVDLHDVMISAQKASIAIETTVQVQRRAVDAYNEIMRMQI